MTDLAIVMPVYNEQEIVGEVLEKWSRAVSALQIDARFHLYNDGSTDDSLAVLHAFAREHPEAPVVIHDKSNSGHGPTVLLACRENSNAKWLFQVDSDDEMGPERFADLWQRREGYDILIGRRAARQSRTSRRIVSAVSRAVVRLFYGGGISDVNSPYRLLRSDAFRSWFEKIPLDTFAPNVVISGIACWKKMRICELDVPVRVRRTGVVSIRRMQLLESAIRSLYQTVRFRLVQK